MYKLFDRLFFISPMSLGDSFVMSGVAHYYGDRCHELHLPAKPEFYETIKTLYQDHPHIKVISLADIPEQEEYYVRSNGLSRIMRVGFVQTTVKGFKLTPMWDMQLYANYQLPFHYRYSNFRLPKEVNGSDELYWKLTNGDPYAIVHRSTSEFPEGLPINIAAFREASNLPNIKIIEITPEITNNMMQYVTLIKRAEEIHVVPSSFHCLVDSIETKAKLFFHDVREKTSMAVNTPWNNFKWIEVNYPQRF
jgi:hypothetical protein